MLVMKPLDWLRLLVAVLLAAAGSILPFYAGYGAVGVWLLGTVCSILLLSCAGGVHRLGFTAIAVLPPFVVNRVTEVIYEWNIYRTTRPPFEALSAMLPETLGTSILAFGMFVAVPIIIALLVRHAANKIPAT